MPFLGGRQSTGASPADCFGAGPGRRAGLLSLLMSVAHLSDALFGWSANRASVYSVRFSDSIAEAVPSFAS